MGNNRCLLKNARGTHINYVLNAEIFVVNSTVRLLTAKL